MASYAALLSLAHTLNQIKKHPRPPISLNQSQADSLIENISFFQDFLERYSCEDDDLESRIAAAAYAAEDVIETHIIDLIHAGTTTVHGDEEAVDLCQCLRRVMNLMMKIVGVQIMDPIHAGLYRGLKRVIQEMDLIKREVRKIKIMRPQRYTNSSVSSASAGRPTTWQSSSTPVFDDAMTNEVLDKLIGQQSSLQIIPIVGMGGIGKTTFARYIYEKQHIVQHFGDILAWVTISQEYSVPEIFRQILCLGNIKSEISENELGERVHKMLWGRRYLIVMDDVWSVEALDKVRFFFPDNNNGSRIMITTRLSNLAFGLSGSHVFRMKLLDEDKSWGLFCETVFGKESGFPIELDNIGKQVAKNCRGLPLLVVVIGGLLKKANWTQEYWEQTLQNLKSLRNLEDGEYCLQILHTSYKELPMHLKACFMYMGIFQEDRNLRITELTELWAAEGILRPTKDKRLEEVAEENIKELIDRNLIFVHELRWNGKVKVCKIHDLLREVCLREAQKQRFLCVLKRKRDLNIPQSINIERRICIHHNTEDMHAHSLDSASLTRSLISSFGWPELVRSLTFSLLRVYSGDYFHGDLASVDAIFKKTNLRLLSIVLRLPKLTSFPSSWFLLWNLQTLKVVIPSSWSSIQAPAEIWEMPLLRHVKIKDVQLPDLPCGDNDLILEDLHTLSRVRNLKLSGEVIKRIPNIKKLKVRYVFNEGAEAEADYCLNNFAHLTKLESLNIITRGGGASQSFSAQNLCYPHSLKKLTLSGTKLNWEECRTKIGMLPLLQFLNLGWDAFCGSELETVEGQFCSLKYLRLACYKLRYWRTEDTHFPCLEHLVLRRLEALEEIPSSIGDIPTLKSIKLYGCSRSAEDSANIIKKEQRELGNTDFKIRIIATGAHKFTTLSAATFMREVDEAFKYQRETYHGVLDAVKDYRARRIDIDGLVHTFEVLFKEHPRLMALGRSLVLPKENDEAAISASGAPKFTSLPALTSFLREVNEAFKYQREKIHEVFDAVNDYSAGRIDVGGFVHALEVLFKEHPRLVTLGRSLFFPKENDEAAISGSVVQR